MVQILQKLLHILNKDQKRKVAGLGVMIFIGALMEIDRRRSDHAGG